jgi:hypothetical protein
VTRALLLLVLVPLLVEAAPKKRTGAPREKRSPSTALSTGPGQVKFVTAEKAYLDRGTADGVTPGQELKVMRGHRPVGTCKVDDAAEHFASCVGVGLQAGDRIAVLRAPPAGPPGPPAALPTEQELAHRHRMLEASELGLVVAHGEGGPTVKPRFAVALSQTSYSNLASAAGPFQQQRVDAAVYDVEVWKGLRISADLTVLNFSRKPDGSRTVFQQTPSLMVRQLEVGFRRADVPFSGALGRTWLRYAPGLLVVDGAQASWRTKGEAVELGAYAGFLPEATRVVFSSSQGTAGAFFMGRRAVGDGETLLQAEARVGYASKTNLGSRFEAALAGHLYRGATLDVHLAGEFGVGDAQAPAAVDAARLDVGWRPAPRLRVVAGARYRGQSPSGVTELGLVSPGQRALHADGAVVFEVTPKVWLGVQGGAAMDFGATLTQARVGPEVTFPLLFGKAGGMSVGYLEELGWLRARHAYVQLAVTAFGRLRVVNRTSWFQQQSTDGSGGLAGNEAGTALGIDVRFARWLWVRSTVSGRMQLENPSQVGGLVSVQLGGQL